MPRWIPKFAIPEPKGFDDPTKRAAAHAERAWEAGTGMLGATAGAATAAVAIGVALPPIAPILAAGAAASFYFKLRAKWAADDPPRPDFEEPVVVPSRQIDLLPLMELGVPPAYVQLVITLEAAGDHLGATVEAVEKSMGAIAAARTGDRGAAELAFRHRTEAHTRAIQASYTLVAVSASAIGVAEAVPSWIPFNVVEGTSEAGDSGAPVHLGDVLTPDSVGRLIAGGVGLESLGLEISLSRSPTQELPGVLREAAEAAGGLASALRRWGVEDQEFFSSDEQGEAEA